MPSFAKEFWALAAPFFLAVGTCYLFGYWDTVGVNVLEFIGVGDVLKLTVYPLLASLSFYGVGLLWSEIVYRKPYPVGGGEHTPIGQFGRKHARAILASLLGAIVAIALLLPVQHKWLVIAPLMIPFGTALTHQEWAITLIPNPTARSNIFQILVTLPVLAFALGRVNADLAVNPKTGKIVNVQRSSLKLTEAEDKPVLYLGFLGDTFVFFESSTGLVVFQKRTDTPLILRAKSGA